MIDPVIRDLIIARVRDTFDFWVFGPDGTQDIETYTALHSEFRSMLNDETRQVWDDAITNKQTY